MVTTFFDAGETEEQRVDRIGKNVYLAYPELDSLEVAKSLVRFIRAYN